MPAVTVENPLTLPRVSAPADAVARPVLTVTTAPSGFEGEGFPVRRASTANIRTVRSGHSRVGSWVRMA
ncbi:hypothetical protein AB0B09_12980, partial [Streptomyces sp. NPDC044948]